MYKTFFSIADYFSVKVLIGIQFMNFKVNAIRRVEQQVKFIKCKVLLLERAPRQAYIETIGIYGKLIPQTSYRHIM